MIRDHNSAWAVRLARSALLLVYYIAGSSLTEALLFLPTALFLVVPPALLRLLGAAVVGLLAALFGEYTTRDGKGRLPVSLIGYLGSRSFRAPPHLQRALPAFPTKQLLSFDNVQVLQALLNLSYEEWALVSDALACWKAPRANAEFITGYSVRSVAWTEPADGKECSAQLDVQVCVAMVNSTAAVVFRGTDPFSAQDWLTDWNLYGPEATGKHGRAHPGMLAALGLTPDLRPLPGVRTEVATTAAGGGTPGYTTVKNSLAQLLQGRLLQLANLSPIDGVLVAGHSLGGALGAVFAAANNLGLEGSVDDGACAQQPKVTGLFTAGQPRLGDARFGRALEHCLGHSEPSPAYLRLVNADDIVSAMPPAGPQDLGPTAYQHAGQLVLVSAFGNVYRQFEQPAITFGTALLVSATAAATATAQLVRGLRAGQAGGAAPGLAEHPSPLLVAAKWAALLFFPHGIVQHAPANYSLAVANSKPAAWRLTAAPPASLLAEAEAELMATKTYRAARRRLAALDSRLPAQPK